VILLLFGFQIQVLHQQQVLRGVWPNLVLELTAVVRHHVFQLQVHLVAELGALVLVLGLILAVVVLPGQMVMVQMVVPREQSQAVAAAALMGEVPGRLQVCQLEVLEGMAEVVQAGVRPIQRLQQEPEGVGVVVI
jgi:hypothetical protein